MAIGNIICGANTPKVKKKKIKVSPYVIKAVFYYLYINNMIIMFKCLLMLIIITYYIVFDIIICYNMMQIK